MIELTDLIQQLHLFPSIDPEKASDAVKAISDNFKDKDYLEYCCSLPLNNISQGDVFTNIPFRYINDDGDLKKSDELGFLLSYGCDCDNDDKVLIAAMMPIQIFVDKGLDKNNLISNKYTRLLYIPSSINKMDEYIIDLNLITSISPKLLSRELEKETIRKLTSLNQLGYYLLVIKLTIHLLRPEDEPSHDSRNESPPAETA